MSETMTEREDLTPNVISMRTINNLPLNQPEDYSPYFGLDFDSAVYDYCRNRNNHIRRPSCDDHQQSAKTFKDKAKFKQQQQRHSSYTSINAPFNKIVRNCKVVVSGDVAVGKTSLVNRFGRGTYSSTYRTTIGVDFDLQRYNILGQPYVLQIWDTAGLERFRCITTSYYRGCQVALLIFDMSNMSTLANVFKWKDEVLTGSKTFDQLANEYNTKSTTLSNKSNLKKATIQANESGPLLFLVGTKCDLAISETQRAFIKEQANKIASILQAELWFVSAQTGENVEQLFNRIAALSFNQCIQGEIHRLRFEASTMGACLKEKILQQQKELWSQSSKLIKITKKKDGDDRRSRCINIQCVIK